MKQHIIWKQMHTNVWTEILNLRSITGKADLFPTVQAGNWKGAALSALLCPPPSPSVFPLLSWAEKHGQYNTLSRTNPYSLRVWHHPTPIILSFFQLFIQGMKISQTQKHSLPARWVARWDLRSCTGADQAPYFTMNTYGEIWGIVGTLLFFLEYRIIYIIE